MKSFLIMVSIGVISGGLRVSQPPDFELGVVGVAEGRGVAGDRRKSWGSWTGRETLSYLIMYRKTVTFQAK